MDQMTGSSTEFKPSNKYAETKKHEVSLTDVGYFICHHVFIVVDSGVGNVRLVPHRHNVQFLERE